jgi:hypothetical protein
MSSKSERIAQCISHIGFSSRTGNIVHFGITFRIHNLKIGRRMNNAGLDGLGTAVNSMAPLAPATARQLLVELMASL